MYIHSQYEEGTPPCVPLAVAAAALQASGHTFTLLSADGHRTSGAGRDAAPAAAPGHASGHAGSELQGAAQGAPADRADSNERPRHAAGSGRGAAGDRAREAGGVRACGREAGLGFSRAWLVRRNCLQRPQHTVRICPPHTHTCCCAPPPGLCCKLGNAPPPSRRRAWTRRVCPSSSAACAAPARSKRSMRARQVALGLPPPALRGGQESTWHAHTHDWLPPFPCRFSATRTTQ